MAEGKNPILDGGRELNYVTQKDVYYVALFGRIINSINNLAKNLGASAVGKNAPPPPIESINVSGPVPSNGVVTLQSELLHWTLTHNAPVQKGIQYITEIDTSPNFIQPHVHDHGCSRSGFLWLPSHDANNNQLTYYMRSYAQYHGSDPCKSYVYGGRTAAIGINPTGTSQVSILNSTGSGTASPTGQQGGRGLGVDIERPAPGPKRSVA